MDEPERTAEAARLWAVAQGLARTADTVRHNDGIGRAPSRVPPLLLFTDPERTPRPWEIAARMPAGSGVIYRHFGSAEARAVAGRLRDVTRARGIKLLIGMDAALADQMQADGVHLAERALSAAYALSGRRPDWILTGAVHSVEAAGTARSLDAVVLSPVFQAGGASAERPALGLSALKRASAGPNRVIALGGITTANAGSLIESGAYGIAAIGGIAEVF